MVLPSSVVGRLVRRLGYTPWLVLLVGSASTFFLPGPSSGTPIRAATVITLAALFVVLIMRLLLAAAHYPTRRLSLVVLAFGVLLWAAGSATVSASQTTTVVTFPAPGEVLCLAAYLGMAGFLLLDVWRRTTLTTAIALETALVCGAAVCLATFAVLTPLPGMSWQRSSERGGLEILLAVLYPLIDLVLFTIVLAQVMLRHRDRSLRTAALLIGFLGLAIADSNFILGLSAETYSSNLVLDAGWGVSFALIVGGACMRPSSSLPRSTERSSTGVVLALAAALAVAVLVVHPDGIISWFVTIPAVVTLVATVARLLLALREAQGTAEALRLSRTDELTGLPNRRALMGAVDDATRAGTPLGLMLLDLDGFKDVNDSLGHGVGDEVLITLGRRMRMVLDHNVLLARLGGDEFALLVPGKDEVRLLEIAHRVRVALQEPMRVENMDLAIDASVGITVREAADTSSTELLRQADIAMYEAKQSRAGALLFDSSQDGFSRQRLRRGDDLRQAIAEDQLVVWYQPQVAAVTREMVGMEALVRWQHPTQGLLAPIAFLPDARRAGLMPALTKTVIRHVLADTCRWIEDGFSFRVAMNWAPPELVGGQLLPHFFASLDQAALPEDILLIEVTEDSFLSDPERAREALYDLQAHHVQVSIDDYGTGFSSLAYLRDLPVQELKMDRSFVSTVVTDERSRMIVQTTAQMAHALGLRLVAEGVEDAEIADELIPLGVDLFQGYHIARPMPASDVGPWVAAWSSEHAVGAWADRETRAVSTAHDWTGCDRPPSRTRGGPQIPHQR
jgi:diguanylate cyclase (GGDEF)-like protein